MPDIMISDFTNISAFDPHYNPMRLTKLLFLQEIINSENKEQ